MPSTSKCITNRPLGDFKSSACKPQADIIKKESERSTL